MLLIHRRDKLRAEKILQDLLFKNHKIDLIGDSEIKIFNGQENINSIDIKNLKTNEISNILVDGVFVAIGHDPATSLFKDQLKMDENGYIVTKPDSTLTSIEGVFAAGDVKDKVYRQAITAAGMGCMAALEVEKYLS